MSQTETKRSGMLSTLYNMLPGIDNDYAAKLVYTLEDKKTIAELEQDIADLAAQLNSDSAVTDTLIAKMLLDECTLSAALKQLRIYNNATSINELCAALHLPAQQTGKLLEVYASFSSRQYFDESFERALRQTQDANLTDEEQALKALDVLLAQVTEIEHTSADIAAQNRTAILTLADRYHLSVKLTAQLELMYSQPASILVQPEFENLLHELQTHNEDISLCASLAARTLLLQITPQDACDIAHTAKLLNNELLEEDLLIIACRYLKVKTPQDIAAAYDAVLKRLPYVHNPEENLGLAVRVLLDGTPASFERANQIAAVKRDREVLRQRLAKTPLYAGYEQELATRFGGKKTFDQVDKELQDVLAALPYCSEATENKDLACKVLLGVLSTQEAREQATYMRDLKASSLTQGFAPELMKHYLGTQTAEELLPLLNKALSGYTFWKSDREKHLFALRILVEEQNGTYNHRISQFVLDMLQSGSSTDILADMLSTIRQKKLAGAELDGLLERYKQARAQAKSF